MSCKSSIAVIAVFLSFALQPCFAEGQCNTPNITLPWGIYCSNAYDAEDDIYTFQNVRFGAPTGGSNRFQVSDYPTTRSSKVIIESGDSCPQVTTKDINEDEAQCIPGGNLLTTAVNESEDCLFLDIYVPSSVLSAAQDGSVADTPVVVWLFGGAYVFGSKDFISGGPDNNPMYNGTGLLNAEPGNVIFVAGNYRLGAFGWLAGTTMYSQGYPNAGLSDQRLLFRWVQDFIHLVGGDKTQVSAWGESAGAGSILHHLISHDPSTGDLMKLNFTKVAIQSPAYEWNWDPRMLEDTFQSFANLALNQSSCSTQSPCSVKDLQSVDSATMKTANQMLYQTTTPCTGLFPIGPSIDDVIIREITPVAFSGVPGTNYSVVDSLIVSHCSNEAESFIPPPLAASANPTEATWQTFMSRFIPEVNASCIRSDVDEQYPLVDGDYTNRAKALIQDAVFVCNVRQLVDAYLQANSSPTVYAMSWNFGDLTSEYEANFAQHTTDLPALFYNTYWDLDDFIWKQIKRLQPSWSNATVDVVARSYERDFYDKVTGSLPGDSFYQSYWKAHAVYGDPNCNWTASLMPDWNPAGLTSDGNNIQNVMQVNTVEWWDAYFVDDQTTAASCQFWTDTAIKVTKILQGTYTCPAESDADAGRLHEDL